MGLPLASSETAIARTFLAVVWLREGEATLWGPPNNWIERDSGKAARTRPYPGGLSETFGTNRVEARENKDRRLFYPVIDFKIRNSFKFLYVIGNQDTTR